MHPAMVSWWRAQGAPVMCGPGWANDAHSDERWSANRCGPGRSSSSGPSDDGFEGGGGGGGWDDGGGGFGVRRPLRFLAYKLELDERQVSELARILNELKTERAQAEVDRRRTISAFADAVAGASFDKTKADEGGALRVASAERLRDAVVKAIEQIHALLDADQRSRLAYLIRTGTLVI